MATKTTNAARISALEEQVAALFEIANKQTEMLKVLVNNQAASKQAVKPAAKKNNTNKAKSKKTKKAPEAPKAIFTVEKAKNGNGNVYWLKFDKPCNNEQYCLLTCRDKKTFAKLEGKKSLWTYSKTAKAYHAIPSEQAKKQGEWFEKNFKPATDEELAVRKAAFNKTK